MKSGFSLIELLISLVVFSLVIPIVYQVSEGVVFSTTAVNVANELKLINQELIQNIKSDVVQSAVVYDYTSSYISIIDLNLPPNYTALNKNKLPVINETGSFPPEPDKVGNILFMAKYLSPVEITVNGTNYRIDCYRFIYYFLAKDTGSTINGKNPIILMRSQSQETYVDYVAINNISDEEKKKALITELYNKSIRYAINLKNTNFYALNSNGNITLENNHTVQMESNPASRDFGANQLPTGKVYYAIGYNNMGLIDIPKFANADNSGDGFPNGFEVAIVGPKSSRDILVRTVVIGYFSGKVLGNENTTIISVPQF
ncbi:MAG TPA: prepilin-type N-terminal cleavage/methylation domain-containing protein [bacterium]|nr:prepilin-type N-terminal cleavage/methylation domain-containing protein [bacterium]